MYARLIDGTAALSVANTNKSILTSTLCLRIMKRNHSTAYGDTKKAP